MDYDTAQTPVGNAPPEPTPQKANGPPVITDPDQYTGPQFSREVIEEFARVCKESWNATVQRMATWTYYRSLCPSLPAANELTPFEVPAVRAIRSIEPGENWADFAKKCNLKLERRTDENNPWLPAFTNKNPDNPNSWNRSIRNTPLETNEGLQQRFISLLRDVSPFGGGSGLAGSQLLALAHSTVGTMPTEDAETLGEIVEKFIGLHPFWLRPLGAEHLDPEFRFGKPLIMLAGLGFAPLRIAAGKLKHVYEGWDFFESCTEEQLRESIYSARRIHGYPIGMLRLDAAVVARFLIRSGIDPGDWFLPLVYLHILKYARYTMRAPGFDGPAIQVIYKGRRNTFPIDPITMKASFGSSSLVKMRGDILRAMGLPASIDKENHAVASVVINALSDLQTLDLCELREVEATKHLVVPNHVQLIPTSNCPGEYVFVDYGIGVTNVAVIDFATGTVRHNDVYIGAHVGAVNWPQGRLDDADLATWKSFLPEKVEPLLPSETAFKYIRNCNDLGFPRARDAAFNTWILIDLARYDLAGTILGGQLTQEFPIAMILPMGHTKEETTNQGKTNLARIIMHSVCSGVPVTVASRSTSAPAQRTAAWPLARYGTAIYDEFQLPSSHDHFLAQEGLQSLSTGSEGGPGQVLENHGAIKLKHPLAICAKIAAFPPDIINRSFCFFMDKLTPENRCTDRELRIIGTGVAANTIRMNALAWMQKIDFVNKAKDMLPTSTEHLRFGVFYTIMVALCRASGGTEEEVIAYLKACTDHCDKQRRLATQSGLAAEIGANGTFDPVYFFQECSQTTINSIITHQNANKVWKATSMLKELVEDGDARKFHVVLGQYHIQEDSARESFSRAVREGRMVADGYKVEAVPDPRPSKAKNNNKVYRIVRGDFSGDPSAPSPDSLRAHLERDTAADMRDYQENPGKYASDMPSRKHP